MSSNDPSSSKKAKKLDPPGRDGDGADFEAVRSHLLSCPGVRGGPDNPAVRAALEGLDRELSRRRRDEALRAKFLREDGGAPAGVGEQQQRQQDAGQGHGGEGLTPLEIVMVDASETPGPHLSSFSSSAAANPRNDDDNNDEDWHEVREDSGGNEHPHGDDHRHRYPHHGPGGTCSSGGVSSLGAELAREAISSVALFEIRVASPVQMVAVALHAAMRGPVLGFACTGLADPTKSGAAGGGGFAPPVRELPKTHFLPPGWNSDPSRVAIRYRKVGVGSTILFVRSESVADGFDELSSSISFEREWIKVSVVSNASTIAEAEAAGDGPFLVFAANEHINLSSFQLALASSSSSSSMNQQQQVPQAPGGGLGRTVAPALHYKGLPALLTRFVEAFDLGGMADEHGAPPVEVEASTLPSQQTLPYVDRTVLTLPSHAAVSSVHQNFPLAGPAPVPPPPIPYPDESRSPTLESAFPGLLQPGTNRGDFPEDLRVGGGGGAGGVGPSSPWVGGNLMGPNHPFFAGGGGISGVGPGSGFGMRPRFDPVGGPPGGPTDVDGDGHTRPPPPPPGTVGNPRRNLGDPNPDHLSPPNSFHSNMFM